VSGGTRCRGTSAQSMVERSTAFERSTYVSRSDAGIARVTSYHTAGSNLLFVPLHGLAPIYAPAGRDGSGGRGGGPVQWVRTRSARVGPRGNVSGGAGPVRGGGVH